MHEDDLRGLPLIELTEQGLGPGLVLAEQRREAGEASPGSRYGFLGRWGKHLIRRITRFQTQRQNEFNIGVTRALRQAESALRELARVVPATNCSLEKLIQHFDARSTEFCEALAAQNEALSARTRGEEELATRVDARFEEAKQELEKLQAAVASIATLREQLALHERGLEVHERHLEDLPKRLTSLEDGLAPIPELISQITRLQRQRARQAKRLRKHDASIQAARQQLISLRDDHTSLQTASTKRLREAEDGFASVSVSARLEREALRIALDEIAQRTTEGSQRVARLETIGEEQDQHFVEFDRRAQELLDQLDALRASVSAGQEASAKKVRILEEASRNDHTHLEENAARLRLAEQSLATLRQQAAELGSRAPVFERQLQEQMAAEAANIRSAWQRAIDESQERTSGVLEDLQRETLELSARFPRFEEALRERLKAATERMQAEWHELADRNDASLVAQGQRLESLGSRVTELGTDVAYAHTTIREIGERAEGRSAELREELRRCDREQERARTRSQALEESFRSASLQLDALRLDIDRLRAASERIDQLETDTRTLQSLLPERTNELGERLQRVEDALHPTELPHYFDFERHFRGSEEKIKEGMRVYVERFRGGRRVLDIGCGRGEFLELCGESAVGAYGVDCHPDMVSRCRGKNLEVVCADALAHLAGLDDRSLDGIFSAQFVEHLSGTDLAELIRLAALKLRRGAPIVLETVNADTYSALRTFHLDLTHRQPILSRTLSFLLDAEDFTIREVLFCSDLPDEARLLPFGTAANLGQSPPPETAEFVRRYDENCSRLNELLFGPQDYAIVAER